MNQEQIRRIGCIIMAVPALAGIVAIELLGTKLYGNITLLQIISVVSLYFIWKAFNRDL